MTDQWVAGADFVAVDPDGTQTPLRVRLGKQAYFDLPTAIESDPTS